jgi:membrane associated rhomboid family serine protease
MLPIQDALPSGRTPIATLSLLAINTLVFAAQLAGPGSASNTSGLSPFMHPSTPHFVINALYLWLFGDNGEARFGRARFVGIYLAAAISGLLVASRLANAGESEITAGATYAITGVLGAYFVVLPKSRVLMLVPAPPLLTEIPAVIFLALWWLLHVASFALARVTEAGVIQNVSLVWGLVASFVVGGAIAAVARRPIAW